MGAISRLMRRGKPPALPGLSVDDVVAEGMQRARAGESAPERQVYGGVYVVRGRKLQTLADRIAVEPCEDFGKIGRLFIPTAQTYQRCKVVSHGPKVKSALTGMIVVVSDFFGDQVKLEDGTKHGRRLRIGRERDIVGVGSDGLFDIIPVGNRILAVRLDPPTMVGGIHIPEDANEKQFKAVVVGVGPDCTVAIGATLLLPKHGSVVVQLEARKLVLIDEPAVLGIL